MTGLDSLFDELDRLERDGDPWVRITSAAWGQSSLALDVTLRNDDGDERSADCQILCTNVRDYRIVDVAGGGIARLDAEHVVVRQHSEPHAHLFFKGRIDDTRSVVGALWVAHRKFADDWIEFDRYLNRNCDLHDLLAGPAGELAEGPISILRTYAETLAAFDVAASIISQRPAKYFHDGSWHEQTAPLSGVHFGNSYVVAEQFSVRMLRSG